MVSIATSIIWSLSKDCEQRIRALVNCLLLFYMFDCESFENIMYHKYHSDFLLQWTGSFLLYFSLRAKESVGQKTSTNHLRQPTVVIAQINVWLFVPSAAERCWLGLSGRTELITSVNNSLVFVLPDWLMPTTQSCKNFTGEAPSLYCTLQKVIVALQRIMWSCMKDYSYNRIYFMSISQTFVAHTYKL